MISGESLPVLLAVALLLIGLCGILLRRNLFYTLLSCNYLVLAILLLFVFWGATEYLPVIICAGLLFILVLLSFLTLFFRHFHNLDVESVVDEQDQQ